MTQQLSQANILAALRDVCAALYPEEQTTRVIVADAGLDERQIAFSARAETNWHAIWLEAIRQDQVDTLLAVIQERYSTNPELQAALTAYQHFLATGGRLNAQALLTAPADAPAPGDPPYQGMAYYDVADADRFFGREALTAALVDHLRHNNLLAVVGASGSGKSSLVRAGVLPALQGKQPLIDGKQPPTGSTRWAYHLITPTAHPLKMLAASLTPANESILAQAQLMDALHVEPRSLDLYAHRLVKGDQRLLLLVDQFEELFTLCKDEGEQQAFVNNLLHAATDDGVVTLVLTLRADFYHHCARFPALRIALERQQKYIGAMTRDELRRAIAEPAHTANWSFQPGLVEQLLHDVGDEPGALPLLSHALLETWQRRRGRTLTLAGYRAAGGVQGAIAKTADDVYNHFTDEQKSIARILFLRLTELGEGVQDTRRRVRPAELELNSADPDTVQQVLKTLADARLVTTDEDEVQVAHEALIRHWETLRAWLDDDREGHRIQRRLTEAANQWVEFGKEPSLLYRGVLLQQAQEWLKNTIDPPNQIETAFLRASQAEVEAEVKRAADLAAERERNRQFELENQRQLAIEQSRRVRIFRNAVIMASLLFLLAVISAGFSYYLNDQLTSTNTTLQTINNRLEQTISVAFSRQLAAQSTSELNIGHYEPAMLLAVSSGQVKDTTESFSAIRATIANLWHTRTLLYGHTSGIYQAVWSKDNGKVLTCGDKTARIWDVYTGKELIKLIGHSSSVHQATWNKDESKVLTSSDDGTARIWDAATGKELTKLIGHTSYIFQATWSKDESKVLTNSTDSTARVWDAATGKELTKLVGHASFIFQATWNKDESRILTSSGDHTARLWDALTGKELIKFEGHTDRVMQATWREDESKILTRSDDNTTRIWDAATGKELTRLLGHTARINQAIWSKSGQKVLTYSDDHTVRIWDINNGKELVDFESQTSRVVQVTWSNDESKILASTVGVVYLWDVATGKELVKLEGHAVTVNKAIWSRDENKILTSSADGTARIWDATSGQVLTVLIGHNSAVTEAKWNYDESKILTYGTDGIARIWDTNVGDEMIPLETHATNSKPVIFNKVGNEVRAYKANDAIVIVNVSTGKEVARLKRYKSDIIQTIWNRDQSKILTSSYDDTARIWDVTTGKELVKLEGHTDDVIQSSWSKNESKVLTISRDNTIRIWSAASGEEFTKLVGHNSLINLALWNQNENKLLTASGDGTARIWDVTTGKELVKFQGHTSSVEWAAWNPNETMVLTSSYDGTIRIWNAVTGDELVKFSDYVRRRVYRVIWSQDGRKILGIDYHRMIIYARYVYMTDLHQAACNWMPRNFTWSEWGIYMQDVQGDYRPTCPTSPIPPDAIAGVQEEARQQILDGQVFSGTLKLKELNGWLQVNGQFKNYGVDVEAFVAEVSVTATPEVLPTNVLTPSPVQPASPLRGQLPSPLSSPTVTPRATGTPVASAPVAPPVR